MRHRLLPVCLALWLTAALIGCGGGSAGSASTGPGQAPPPAGSNWPMGRILARVTDTNGLPITGAVVRMVQSSGEYVDGPTNAQGEVLFVNVPVGATIVKADSWGYYDSPSQTVQVEDRVQATVPVSLEPRDPFTTVILGSRVISKGTDGKTLEFEIDVGVLDPSGQPLTNLADEAFNLPRVDCGWGPCLTGPAGWIPDAWYDPVTGRPQSFALQPAQARSPVAAGLLVDQGAGAKWLEPQRSAALAEFLTALGGNDSTLLAEYRGKGSIFSFTPSGGFVADGRSLLPLAQGLPARLDSEDSDPVAGTQSMLSYLAQQSSTAPQVLVALTSGDLGCDVPASSSPGWMPSCRQLVELSVNSGIPVTTMSGAISLTGADLARRTGGAAFFTDFPTQYRTAMRGLLSVVGSEIPFYRIRFAVKVGAASEVDVLAAGNTLYGYLQVRPSERDVLYADVVVPL